MDVCLETCVHSETVSRARDRMPTATKVQEMADLFRLLSEPSRLRLVLALRSEELCVCDLAALTGATISSVSHQLRLLRTAGLVANRKEGKMVYYSQAQGPAAVLLNVILQGQGE